MEVQSDLKLSSAQQHLHLLSSIRLKSCISAVRLLVELEPAINANWESHDLCVLVRSYTLYFVVFHQVLKIQSAK